MIGRGLFILTVLSNCVLSLPVTSSQLENEDVKVLKCIVEALADVLSRPHPVPVSQECLVTLKTDDRLVSILRHHNFLKELQEIAVLGGKERNQLQQDAGIPDPTTQGPQTTDAGAADRSMLEALGGPGEKSILSQKRRTGNVDEDKDNNESLRDGESQEDNDSPEEIQVKRENDESPGSHVSESVDEWSKGKARTREEDDNEEEEEREETKANSEENSEEENMTKDEKAAGSDQKSHAPGNESKEKKFHEEDEEETDKRSVFSSHKHEEQEVDEREMKRGSKEHFKQWTKRGKGLQQRKKADGKQLQEVPHHSKEVSEEADEEEKKRDTQRSPEEKELQVIAQKAPEDRRMLEEEGSASRKSEEPEIESLAAIESELENVAQKLHELRRG